MATPATGFDHYSTSPEFLPVKPTLDPTRKQLITPIADGSLLHKWAHLTWLVLQGLPLPEPAEIKPYPKGGVRIEK